MKTEKGQFWVWDKWIAKWVKIGKYHFGVNYYRSQGYCICLTKDFKERETVLPI